MALALAGFKLHHLSISTIGNRNLARGVGGMLNQPMPRLDPGSSRGLSSADTKAVPKAADCRASRGA
jgi:hypothetical protein